MQTIEISGITGSGTYDVYVCDITFSYCQLVVNSVSIPPNYSFVLTGMLSGVNSVIVKIVDVNTGCEKFVPYYCPSNTPTETPTPTPTPSLSTCLCISVQNSGGMFLPFTYINCLGITVYDDCPPLTTLFICSQSVVYSDPSLTVIIQGPCIDGVCPDAYVTQTPTPSITNTPTISPTQSDTPTPTPTVTSTIMVTPTPTITETPTPTPTSPIVGNKLFQSGDNFIFMLGDYYIFENQ